MVSPSRAHLPGTAASVPAALYFPWVAGPLLYSQWLTSVLDAQTTSWREMERQTASLMQLWFDPATPPPSAQPWVDATQGIAPLGPTALQRTWAGWLQVWVGALRHDAAEQQ
jgi:hypothetical protein